MPYRLTGPQRVNGFPEMTDEVTDTTPGLDGTSNHFDDKFYTCARAYIFHHHHNFLGVLSYLFFKFQSLFVSMMITIKITNTVKCRYNAVFGVQEIDRVIAVTAL